MILEICKNFVEGKKKKASWANFLIKRSDAWIKNGCVRNR